MPRSKSIVCTVCKKKLKRAWVVDKYGKYMLEDPNREESFEEFAEDIIICGRCDREVRNFKEDLLYDLGEFF